MNTQNFWFQNKKITKSNLSYNRLYDTKLQKELHVSNWRGPKGIGLYIIKCSKKYLEIHNIVECYVWYLREDSNEYTGTLPNPGSLYILDMFVIVGVGNGVPIGLRWGQQFRPTLVMTMELTAIGCTFNNMAQCIGIIKTNSLLLVKVE